jgi:hypothetical protein
MACPLCRDETSEIRRNHDLVNLAEAYLTANPDKQRGAAELAEMDARSTITADSLRLKGNKRRRQSSHSDDEGDEDDYDSEDDYDRADEGGGC